MILSISSSKTTTSYRAELRSAVHVVGVWDERDVGNREAAEEALDRRSAMNRGLAISDFSD
jgi:hypothetical protein